MPVVYRRGASQIVSGPVWLSKPHTVYSFKKCTIICCTRQGQHKYHTHFELKYLVLIGISEVRITGRISRRDYSAYHYSQIIALIIDYYGMNSLLILKVLAWPPEIEKISA
jgi:hypothetical protein